MIVLTAMLKKFSYDNGLYFAKRAYTNSLAYHFCNELVSYKKSKLSPELQKAIIGYYMFYFIFRLRNIKYQKNTYSIR